MTLLLMLVLCFVAGIVFAIFLRVFLEHAVEGYPDFHQDIDIPEKEGSND